jgi:hypothetical protein
MFGRPLRAAHMKKPRGRPSPGIGAATRLSSAALSAAVMSARSSSASVSIYVQSGGVWPYRYLQTISPEMWSSYQAVRAAYLPTPRDPQIYPTQLENRDAQSWVASIPTSGGVTLAAGSTQAQIQSALNANSVVFLQGGTYSITSMLTVPSGKWLIGVAGATVVLDATTFTHGIQVASSANIVNLTIYRPREYGIWLNGDSQGMYKISLQAPAYGIGNGIGIIGGGHSAIGVSVEVLNVCGGGNGDGWDLGQSGASGNHTLIDCHTYECDDDGFDTWDATYRCWMHYCTAGRSGLNTVPGAISGDGNGYKLGRGVGTHVLNRCVASNNEQYGYNKNGTSAPNNLTPALLLVTAPAPMHSVGPCRTPTTPS